MKEAGRRMAAAALCAVFAICGMYSHAVAQEGTWQLQKIDSVLQSFGDKPLENTWPAGKREWKGWHWEHHKEGYPERKVVVGLVLTKLSETLKPNDWISFDSTITVEVTGPGPEYATAKCDDDATTSSGHVEHDFPFTDHRVAVGKKEEFGCGVRMTELLPPFPKEDFTVRLRVSVDDKGPRYARLPEPYAGDFTLLLRYKWMSGVVAGNSNIRAGNVSVEYDTDRPGADYRNFDLPEADFETCRSVCAGDANCKAYTYVKPGVQGSNARCWLKSSVPPGGKSSCCISGTKP